jgi:uncharacterized oxidoreductase
MNMTQNTILVTGGSNGIGLALAERFLAADNRVIICGRREDKLREAEKRHPGLITKVCDVAVESERLALSSWLAKEFSDLNILINNAGIQNRINVLTADREWAHFRQEIAINLEAPVHLSLLLVRRFVGKSNAAIINISSGLAFMPMAASPLYSATKVAIRSFTMSLRRQLAASGVNVVEIIPPMVQTDLCAPGVHSPGVPVAEFADAVMRGLIEGRQEIAYGHTIPLLNMSRDELEAATNTLNARIPLPA